MTALGRGLASLIPKRETESPEDIIEKIDTMEVVEEEPEHVRKLREGAAGEGTSKNKAKKQKASESVSVTRKKLNVIEEIEELDDGEAIPMPEAPNVTPLTIDPETGMLAESVSGEAEAAASEEAATEETQPAALTQKKAAPRQKKQQAAAESQSVELESSDDVSLSEPLARAVKELEEEDEPQEAVAEEKQETVEESEEAEGVEPQRMLGENVEYLTVGDIEVNPLQPRRSVDAEEMEELKSSLDQHGMLQPLVVAEKEDDSGFVLIAGERRLRAVKELKWKTAPAVVRRNVTGDRNRLELALIENVQRQNLNPVEEAMGYQRLSEEYGMTHEEIGERVGRSRVGITNIIRLLQLPAEIQRGLIEDKISVGHARAILMIPDEEKQLRFYQHVVDEGLTVRKAENRARNIQRTMKLSDPLRKKTRGRPALALKFDGPLQEKFGHNARVKFLSSKNRFEVVFYAYSEQEVEELVGRLMGTESLPETVDEDVKDE